MAPKYTNSKGRTVAGTAAMLHTISQNGGWDKHHEKVITEFIRRNTKELQTLLAPEQRRSNVTPLRKVR